MSYAGASVPTSEPELEREKQQRQNERHHYQREANPGFNQFGAFVEHAQGPKPPRLTN